MILTRQKSNIHKVVLVFLMISGPLMLSAQTGATSPGSDTSATYLTPMEYAFMMHEEPKFMLRMPVLGLGAEVKLLPGLTLMGQLIYLNVDPGQRANAVIELRYYHNRKGARSDHMSGNYLAFGAAITQAYPWYLRMNQNVDKHPTSLLVRYGVQRRVFGHGMLDMGLELAWERSAVTVYSGQQDIRGSQLVLNSPASIGLGWVFAKSREFDWERLCPVTKCYQSNSWMLKLNTAGLVHLNHSLDYGQLAWIRLMPKVALEHKLFNSAFSINTGGAYNGTLHFGQRWLIHEYSLFAEGRWYYNLKRRMVQGKTGNGLSANYIALGSMYAMYETLYLYLDSYRAHTAHASQHYAVTGVQRTLGDRFYFDVKLGLGVRWYENGRNRLVGSTSQLDIAGDVQIGFRF